MRRPPGSAEPVANPGASTYTVAVAPRDAARLLYLTRQYEALLVLVGPGIEPSEQAPVGALDALPDTPAAPEADRQDDLPPSATASSPRARTLARRSEPDWLDPRRPPPPSRCEEVVDHLKPSFAPPPPDEARRASRPTCTPTCTAGS